MLLPADRIVSTITNELEQLKGLHDDTNQGSLQQSLDIAMRLLGTREHQGHAFIKVQLQQLADTLTHLSSLLSSPNTSHTLARLLESIQRLTQDDDLHNLEIGWRQVLQHTEALVQEAAREPNLEPADRNRLAQALTDWETGDLRQQIQQEEETLNHDAPIDIASLQRYLQDRFKDSELTVNKLHPLSGGFGKQTFLFEVSGAELNGDFVMRRDTRDALLENDCHRIHREYEVIRAVHQEGFPAPEAIWLDTEHALLPGGDFLIMARAPGEPGGSVFASQSEVPLNLTETLATILAKLHALPPLPALHNTSNSINHERWLMPLSECVRQYLQDWFHTFMTETHLPSPAIVSQFTWLLANIPETPGKPVLLHGDIGFHNFLFDKSKLSVVLDWEFAHLGDPAEDLAYVRNTLGSSLDWESFITAYQEAGGHPVEEKRLRFFQVWGHLRNAASSNIAGAKFASGQADGLKLVMLPHIYVPQFLQAAQSIINEELQGEAQ